MKAVLISGSIRKGSYNTTIVEYLKKYLQSKYEIDSMVFYGINQLPFFSPDLDNHTLENDDSPETVVEFRKELKSADFVILSTPEYAFEISGVLKNALDWVVSSGEFVDKNVAVISSSTSDMGGENAYQVLVKLLKVLNAKVFEEELLNIKRVASQIDENGNLNDELQDRLLSFVDKFISITQ